MSRCKWIWAMRGGGMLLLTATFTLACGNLESVRPQLEEKSQFLQSGTVLMNQTCGAQATVIITDIDTLYYGDPMTVTVDTMEVCESWMGTDYASTFTLTGSSVRLDGDLEDVATVSYDNDCI